MDKKNLVISAVVSLAVVLLVAPFFKGTVIERIIERVGVAPGGTFDMPVEFHDTVTNAGLVNATTTGGSTGITLAYKDLNKFSAVSVRFTGAADTNVTYTFPASTTLGALVKKVGGSREICYYNVASTTSNHNLLFAEGTGVALKVASSTAAASVTLGVGDGGTACLTFFGEANRDGTLGTTSVFMTAWKDA